MARTQRQSAILDIIQNSDIETQEELTSILSKGGFRVTQATVSRDIKELGLIKIADDKGSYKYGISSKKTGGETVPRLALFKEIVTSVAFAENIVVIKTIGGAASTAAALIDGMKDSRVLGSVAGDNTVFIAASSKDAAKSLVENYAKLTTYK